MATHRVSLQHLTRAARAERPDRQDQAQAAHSRFELGFAVFMLAPVSLALTVFAISWISKMSF